MSQKMLSPKQTIFGLGSRISYRHRSELLRAFTFLVIATLCFTIPGVAAPIPVKAVEKTADGAILTLDPGTLKLQVCTNRLVRVSYSPVKVIPAQTDFVVIKKWTPIPFNLREEADTVSISTNAMAVQVNRSTGALTFTDMTGHVILRESVDGGKKMTAATVNGEATFTAQQSFASPPDEYLYGMCQGQDGTWNWRGMPIELRQLNTQTALPVLISSKGYGLLWNNASLTNFNPVDDEVPLTLEGAPASNETNSPQATEQIGAPATGDKNRGPAVRTGTFTSGDEGDYVFFAKEGDRSKEIAIEVDGERIAGVANYWVPYTTAGKIHLPAGKVCHVKLIGGGKNVKLCARPLGDRTTFRSQVGDSIDYYVFFGPKIDDIIAGIRTATGDAPMWPKWAFGFWQCRERYSRQQQILDAVAEFRRRKIPLDLVVQDWQYWGQHGWGAYQWNASKYPDPKAMIDSLHAQNTKFMISVWSNPSGPVHDELAADGLLINNWVDAFSAKAREIRWKYINDAFFKIGTDAWWQDATEPGDSGNSLDKSRSTMGSGNRLRNAYPLFANQTVYEGQRATTSDKRVVILTRSFFPGEQRYAAALWSGDIGGTWDGFRRQIPAGLNACLTGLPYWTTDCAGFFHPKDQYTSDDFNELLVRWFQYSTFSPILRIHGYQTETEMWKFPKAYDTLVKYDHLRYRLLPYNYSLAWQVTSQGSTIMRALPMDFPEDERVYGISDQYMDGPAFLVSPVTTAKATSRKLYLPGKDPWTNFWTGETVAGGQEIDAAAPQDTIPLFVRAGSIVPLGPNVQYAMESPSDPIELRVYTGADGSFTLYDDEGDNYNYEKGSYSTIPIRWDERSKALTIGARQGSYPGMASARRFNIVWVSRGHGTGDVTTDKADLKVSYTGNAVRIDQKQ
jgi:alpha-D-xyloside xylohydrolase